MHIFSTKICVSVLEAWSRTHSFYICAVYSLKQVVNGLWLHRPCLSTLRWTLKDLSVDGERDYGQFMVVLCIFLLIVPQIRPWTGVWSCWDRPPLEAYRVSAGMPGDWHLAKSYTRSRFHSLLRLHVDLTYKNTALLCVQSNSIPQPQHSVCQINRPVILLAFFHRK